MAAPFLPAKRAPLPEHLLAQLSAPLPAEAVTPHPSKPYLSSIKNIYTIERLNDVFGVGGWTFRSEIIENDPTKKMVVMKVTLFIEDYGISLEQFGGNDNDDRGDAYKGAITDALSKIGSYLGIGMQVYKGGGPTKQNPRPKPAQRPKLVPQPVVAAAQVREVEYEEIPMDASEISELEEQLAASAAIVEAFAKLKQRYQRIEMNQTYGAILGQHGQQHAAGFNDIDDARACYRQMFADITRREEAHR